MNIKLEIKNGDKVFDKITGFEGYVTATVVYITGEIRYCVERTNEQQQWIDAKRLEVKTKNVINL